MIIANYDGADMARILWTIPIVLLCVLVARGADPTTQPTLLDVSMDKAAFDAAIGKDVIVQGFVSNAAWSASGKVMNIEFRNAARSRFLAVMFERNRAKIDAGFGGDVAKALTGAKVRLRGSLESYGGAVESMKGRPQLIINLGDQISILELPAGAGATSPR